MLCFFKGRSFLLPGVFALSCVATVVGAQPLPVAGQQVLPMRNLQIEVRQVRGSSQSQSDVNAQPDVTLQPGRSGANAGISAQNSQRSDSRDLVQRVLVLNGRTARINLGNSRPLQLLLVQWRGGARQQLGATVFVDANSGFSATPVWRGGDSAELELAAMQAARTGSGALAPLPSSSVGTSLSLPLGEWVTVAESDDATSTGSGGFTGAAQSSGREALRVEVRLSVR